MRGSSQQDAPPNYRFIKPLCNGMGGLFVVDDSDRSGETWQDRINRINQRRAREREVAAKLLEVEERDCQYRAVASQLGLLPQHVQVLLERGLTLAEIKQVGFRSWEPGKRVTGVTSQLAGIDSKGNRLVGSRGIFIPAHDPQGNIVGAQLKTDSGRPGKYIWLSSYKEDVTGGNRPHLANGELPLFVWRHSRAVPITSVIVCEGALKSAITALLLWRIGLTDIAVIGTAASGFFGSDTLKSYLKQLAPLRVQLTPDAGAVNNMSNIPSANRQTIKLCQAWGYSVDVLWWGQTYKNQHLDIDELLVANQWGRVRMISPDEFFQLHPAAIRKKLENNDPGDRAEQAQLNWEGFSRIKQWLQSLQKRFTVKGFGKQSEEQQTQAKPQVDSIDYLPGKLPRLGDYLTPVKIKYKPELLPQLIIEARALGWQDILDTSQTGAGKSHRYSTLSYSTLGVDESGRAWLLSQSHRNPTTAPAEHNYADMPVRTRTGFVVDPDRKTATGKPYLRYPTTEEAKSLHQGNCHLADLIHAAAVKGIESASKEAQFNSFCAICKHKDYCGQCSGPGYGYRYERRKIFENEYQVRSSIDSLLEPGNYQYERDAVILDEPLQQLKPVRVHNIDLTNFAAQWDELDYRLPQVAVQLAPLKTVLAPLVRGVDIPYYGLNHEQLLPLLPPVPEDFADTLDRIREAMIVDIAALTGDTLDTAPTQEKKGIAALKAKIKQGCEKLEKLSAELFELQQLESELRGVGQQLSLQVEFQKFKYTSAEAKKLLERLQKLPIAIAAVEVELRQLQAELEQQQRNYKIIKNFNHSQYQVAKRSLQDTIDALPKQWLVPLLEVWSGQSRGALRIDRFGLKVTVLDDRHNRILNSIKTRYYLDATATPKILAFYRQIPVAQFLWIEQQQPLVDNLDFVWVTGIGLASKRRSENCDQRLKLVHATLKEKHLDLATFDWKSKKEILNADGHYYSGSTRGTNEFIERTAIAAIGLPMPDVASYYDLWLTIKTDDSLSFDDFYRQQVDAEIIQVVGRLRANRRLDKKLTFYLIGDTEKCRVASYQPPAQLKPQQVEVRDLCSAAASKSELAWLGICEVIKRWWTENGELPTQKEVSEQTGIDRSWISKLAAQFIGGWKCFKSVIQSLVAPPYNSWTLMESLPDDFEWVAKTYLLLVCQNPSLEVAQELNGLLQVYGWRGWVQILNQTSQSLRLNLIAALFRNAFPDRQEKSDLSSPKFKAAGLV